MEIRSSSSLPQARPLHPAHCPFTRRRLPARLSEQLLRPWRTLCSSQLHSIDREELKYQGDENEQLSSETHYTTSAEVRAHLLDLLNLEKSHHLIYLALD